MLNPWRWLQERARTKKDAAAAALAARHVAAGNRLLHAGDVVAAAAAYAEALQARPDDVNALVCLGFAMKELGRWSEARLHLNHALTLRPQSAETHYLLAQVEEGGGDLPQAVQRLVAALVLQSSFEPALRDLLRIYKQQPRLAKEQALSRRHPDASALDADQLTLLGALYAKEQAWRLALACCDRILQLQPHMATGHHNRGEMLRRLERFEEALASYALALQSEPDRADSLVGRGKAFKSLLRWQDALACFQQASLIEPHHVDALMEEGFIHYQQGDFDLAEACYQRAHDIDSENPKANVNLAACRLLRGDYKNGLRLYEYRSNLDDIDSGAPHIAPDQKQARWSAQECTGEETLLLYSEQGFGDTLQFCRYVPQVAAMAAMAGKVVLWTQAPLHSLLQHNFGAVAEVISGAVEEEYDLHCSLPSLPLALAMELEDVRGAPYLQAPPHKQEQWGKRLGDKQRPRVGVAWSGNPQHANDRNRSMGMQQFSAMLVAGADYIVLQKQIRAEDMQTLTAISHLVSHGEELHDFADTAGLTAQLDWVISVDTSVAHLAAAMGKETWLLLPAAGDWRWLRERRDSPWYDSMRLYRQPSPGDWDSVVREVQADMRARLGGEQL